MFIFGPFSFDPRDRSLTRDGVPLALTPKAADLLMALLEGTGRIVSKDDLMQRVWPDTFVDESSLTFHIHQLREALGGKEEGRHYVRTHPKRGYSFAPSVRIESAGEPVLDAVTKSQTFSSGGSALGAARVPAADQPSAGRTGTPFGGWLLGGLATAALTLILVSSTVEPPLPHVAATRQLTSDGRMKTFLLPFDESRAILAKNDEHVLLRLADGAVEAPPAPPGFQILSFARGRRTILAVKPGDRGAEEGLWMLSSTGGPPARVGMARARSIPAWSRRGNAVAYARNQSLLVLNVDTLSEREVARVSGDVMWPAWSPDDRTIRITVRTASARGVKHALWDVDVSTGALGRVVEDTEIADACCGQWIPNSHDYVFLGKKADASQIWLVRERPRLLGHARRHLIELTSDGGSYLGLPVPSTDGRRLFVIRRSPPATARYDAAKLTFEPHLGGRNARFLRFSRDRRWVTYIDDGVLWRADGRGSSVRRLTPPEFTVHGSEWSPDGTLIALYAEEVGKQAKGYLIPASGGEPRPLSPADVAQGIPTWSQDGRFLAFGDVPETWPEAVGSERIHLFDRMTGTTTDVPGSTGLWSSRWSPDGRYIAALTIDRDQQLSVFDVAGQRWRTLPVRHANDPMWSADSRFIYLDPEGPETRLRRVRVADGFTETVLDLKERGFIWVGVDPDGAPLVTQFASDVYVLELSRR